MNNLETPIDSILPMESIVKCGTHRYFVPLISKRFSDIMLRLIVLLGPVLLRAIQIAIGTTGIRLHANYFKLVLTSLPK